MAFGKNYANKISARKNAGRCNKPAQIAQSEVQNIMLKIKNLHAEVGGKKILNGMDLSVKRGEIHVIMGPNGSGKSTFAYALLGHPKYKITKGKISLKNRDITKMATEKRACAGLFLGFQHPHAIPGVSIASFLMQAYKSQNPKESLNPREFCGDLHEKLAELKLDEKFFERSLNEGFSGGEKKKMEILQMLVLNPDIAILDEIDSGLDIDALKLVIKKINEFAKNNKSVILITHNIRVLKHIKANRIHIMMHGKIVKSGDNRLAKTLEAKGFDFIEHLNEK